MKVKLDKVCKRIYAGGDVPKDRYSTVMTSEYTVPIYANAEKDDGLYGYTDTARENELSITVAARGTIGFTAIRREPFLPVVRLITVVPDVTKVSERYLYYALRSCKPTSSGTSIPQLTVPDIKKNEIELYSLPVQEKIADKLDVVVRIIALRQQELQRLDDLVKARFVELFGDMFLNFEEWNEAPLESLADIVSGITKGRKVSEKHLIKVPYMAVSNVKEGYIDWTTVKTIEATEQEINQYRLLPDDVLMTEGGDPDKLGRGAIIKTPLENCIHQNHIFRVRLDETHILPVYFAEYLQHQRAKRYFLGCAKQTTGIASINMRQLKALPVLIPPLDLQNQFAAFVTQTDKSKAAIQKALDEAQLLFDSLMQKYFG